LVFHGLRIGIFNCGSDWVNPNGSMVGLNHYHRLPRTLMISPTHHLIRRPGIFCASQTNHRWSAALQLGRLSTGFPFSGLDPVMLHVLAGEMILQLDGNYCLSAFSTSERPSQ
jgi:hypothetical protein